MPIGTTSRATTTAALVLGLALPLVTFATSATAQTPGVTTSIEVTLDLFDLDTALLDEPYATALATATTATLTLTYPPFDWAEVHEDSQGLWATYWTFRPRAMTYDLQVGNSRWQGTSTDAALSASRVTFGSFASADGSIAFRVRVADDALDFELRAEELPGDVPMFNRPFADRQPFPVFADDLTPSYARRIVVEMRGLGATSVVFTGPAFFHGEPVLGVEVEPQSRVATRPSSWGAVKSLYH